jgi:catalase-peroxidase
MIVLGGCAAIEKAAKDAGNTIAVPFTPGRGDAELEQTDIASFAVLEPKADGFRNYKSSELAEIPAEVLLIDQAQLLTLTAAEMTVLLGGMRVLGTNYNGSSWGVLTNRIGALTNEFFVNLLDLGIVWKALSVAGDLFEGTERTTGKVKYTATRADLIFGSNSELRAVAEVYACKTMKEKFIHDFIAAWNKVMNLDRF